MAWGIRKWKVHYTTGASAATNSYRFRSPRWRSRASFKAFRLAGSWLRSKLKEWIESPPRFERLVLGCIQADFCNQILVGKLSLRSTRFAFLCTAQIAKFRQKNRPTFCEIEYWIFNIFALVQFDFAIFLWNFDEILSEFRDKSQKIMKIIEMLMKNAEKMRKFLENSGIAGKIQSGYWIFQSCPYLIPARKARMSKRTCPAWRRMS